MPPPDEETSVSYSVKELLREIKSSVDKLYGKLDAKADRTEVMGLSQELQVERRRINDLEAHRAADVEAQEARERVQLEHREKRNFLWPLVCSVLLVAIAGLGLILSYK